MIAVEKLEEHEEAALAKRTRTGDQRAMQTLVKSNLPLVFHIAKHYRGPLDQEDKIQEGVAGLIRAAELFEPAKGVRFGTYAAYWIRQAIGRAIANQSRQIRLPVQVDVRVRKIEKEAEVLSKKLGRAASIEELSKAVGLPPKKLNQYARVAKAPVSLSVLPGDLEATLRVPGAENGPAYASPEKRIMDDVLRGSLAKSLNDLKTRERYILGRRFGLLGEPPETLRSIAKDIGLSRERVRQIVANALRKIRESEYAEGLRAFVH